MADEGTEDAAPGADGSREDLFKIFSSRTNRSILSLLAVEPTYPRKIGNLLALSEAEVARRLKHMEGLGLVASSWSYVGKNIKLYRLATEKIQIRFAPEGILVDLGRGPAKASPSFTIIPYQPAVPQAEEFVGREAQLELLAGPERVVVVDGMPGIGKTALVASHVRSTADLSQVFWHSFRGLESLGWLVNRFGVFLAQRGNRKLLQAIEQGAELSDKRELLLQNWDDPGFLIVFDDVQRIEDPAVREFIADALERVQRARLIVVGREAPRFHPALPRRRILHLEGMRDPEVARFFEGKGVALSPDDLPKVRREVGGHPLALHLLLEAAHELKVPVQQLLDRIPERNIEDYLLQEVYQTLTEDERQTLFLASVFRSSFTVEDLNALTRRNTEHVLLRLRRRHLAESAGPEYVLHEVIRNFFYKLLKDRAELHAKAAQRYLDRASVEGRLEAMYHFVAAGRRDRVLDLLESNLDLKEFDFIDTGYQNLYFDILSLFTRAEVTDPRRWALIQDEKGDICLHGGDARGALRYYEEAHSILERSTDQERLLDLAWKRGLALEKMGRADEARKVCSAAVEQSHGDSTARKRVEKLLARLKPAPITKKAKAR